jgi:hypothetical protein
MTVSLEYHPINPIADYLTKTEVNLRCSEVGTILKRGGTVHEARLNDYLLLRYAPKHPPLCSDRYKQPSLNHRYLV